MGWIQNANTHTHATSWLINGATQYFLPTVPQLSFSIQNRHTCFSSSLPSAWSSLFTLYNSNAALDVQVIKFLVSFS